MPRQNDPRAIYARKFKGGPLTTRPHNAGAKPQSGTSYDSRPTQTPDPPAFEFSKNQISDSLTASERSERLKSFSGDDAMQMIVQGIESEDLSDLAKFMKRNNVEDYFVNRSGSQATIHFRDDQPLTWFAGEVDFGRVKMINTRDNEITVRFNRRERNGED